LDAHELQSGGIPTIPAREAAEMAAALARLQQRRPSGGGSNAPAAALPPSPTTIARLMPRLAAHVSRGVERGDARADDVALALWAHAKLRMHPGAGPYRLWLASLVRAAAGGADDASSSSSPSPPPPDDVSLVQALWSTAQLRDPLPDGALRAVLDRAVAPRLPGLGAHGLSSLLWALAVTTGGGGGAAGAAAAAGNGAVNVGGFNSGPDPEFLRLFWRACLDRRSRPLRGALPQAHANLLYAAARLSAGGGGGGNGGAGGESGAAAAPRRSFLGGRRRVDEEEDEEEDDEDYDDDDDGDDPLGSPGLQQSPSRPTPSSSPPPPSDLLLQRLPPDAWIREVLETSRPNLGRWGPQDAANALWALARLQRARRRRRVRRARDAQEENDDEVEDPELEPLCARWIDALLRSVASTPERVARFRGGELAQLLWALAELRAAPPHPQGRLLLAAALRWRRPAVVAAAADSGAAGTASSSPAPHMRAGEWAVLLRAAALLQRCEPVGGGGGGGGGGAAQPETATAVAPAAPLLVTESWLREAQSAVLSKLRFGDAADLTVTLWALAATATGLARRARADEQQQQQEEAEQRQQPSLLLARPQLDPTRPYYYAPRSLFRERWFAESHSRLFFFEARHAAAALWALARLRWRPPQAWSDRLFLETFSRLPDASAGEIASMMRSLAALRVRPPVQWAAAAAGASAMRLREGPPFALVVAAPPGGAANKRGATPVLRRRGASLRDAARLAQGMAALRYRPPDRWFDALRTRLEMEEEVEEGEEAGGALSSAASDRAALKEAVRRLRMRPAGGGDTIAGRATYGGFG
jgi:hypothetical protein